MAGDTSGLEAALARVVRLAGEHIGALDPSVRHMAAHAWVGGGAGPFAVATRDQRNRLQQAFETAAGQIAERIRALGGQAAAPSLTTPLHIVVPSRGDGYAGMDVEMMGRLVSDLDRAGHELPTAAGRLSAELSTACVAPAPAKQVADIATWAGNQAADLRRRLTLIQERADGDLAAPSLVGFGLFGGSAADPDGVGKALNAAASGDTAALEKVLAAQNTGKDPTLAARVNAWWRLLDPAARQRLLDTNPHLVGSLNGVPSATRDSANRSYLAMRKAAVDRRIAELRGSQERKAQAELEALEAERRQITAVEKSLAMGGTGGRPPALLLQVEFGGLGKAAISFGDPDKADSIVTSVPGTDSKLEGIRGDAERAVKLWDQANGSATGPTKTASIIWLGYEAPQLGVGALRADTSVASPTLAKAGAGPLAGFVDGLHATHQPTGTPRYTVLGHSYGSVVVGMAAQARKGTFADQLIILGSPGTMSAHASELGVKRVWMGESPQDPVADLGHLPLGGGRHPITGLLHPSFPNGEGPFGTDPSNIAFGADRFVVDPVPPKWYGYDIDTHSGYWAPNSSSLRNMGFIINGQYDDVTLLPTPKPKPVPTPQRTSPPPERPDPDPVSPPSPVPQPSPTPTGE